MVHTVARLLVIAPPLLLYEALNYLMNEKPNQIEFDKRERIGFKK